MLPTARPSTSTAWNRQHSFSDLPYDRGGLLDKLYQDAKVEQVDYDETINVVAVCTPKVIGQLGTGSTRSPPDRFR